MRGMRLIYGIGAVLATIFGLMAFAMAYTVAMNFEAYLWATGLLILAVACMILVVSAIAAIREN